jgi:hypothetical protein
MNKFSYSDIIKSTVKCTYVFMTKASTRLVPYKFSHMIFFVAFNSLVFENDCADKLVTYCMGIIFPSDLNQFYVP